MNTAFYDSLETWEKRSLTNAMSDICRDHVMTYGWGAPLTDEQYHLKAMSLMATLPQIFHSDRMSSYSGSELGQIIDELATKLKGRFRTYGSKEPTPKQIYYYVDLCLKAGEAPRHILSNFEIGQEITRLKEEVELLESEDVPA